MNERNYCGADCASCPSAGRCRGCRETFGSPFGGSCVAAEYIKAGGEAAYAEFKRQLLAEINALLASEGIPAASGLFELTGSSVNLEYTLPGGEKAKFLKDSSVYLGTQVELADSGVCCGAVADTAFILLSRCLAGGGAPELLLYRQR